MRHVLLAIYALVCLAALIWPGYSAVGRHIEPMILGLPLSLAWVIGWVTASFFALLAYHLADQRAENARTGEP